MLIRVWAPPHRGARSSHDRNHAHRAGDLQSAGSPTGRGHLEPRSAPRGGVLGRRAAATDYRWWLCRSRDRQARQRVRGAAPILERPRARQQRRHRDLNSIGPSYVTGDDGPWSGAQRSSLGAHSLGPLGDLRSKPSRMRSPRALLAYRFSILAQERHRGGSG